MVTILVVDDDKVKRAKIGEVIRNALGTREVSLVDAATSAEAAKHLEDVRFDLMVLDLNLPVRDGRPATADAGFQLLKQIARGGPRFKRPAYILGITGFGDIFEKFESQFLKEGWQLVRYDATSSEWASSLTSLLLHIASSGPSAEGQTYDFDLGIVAALKPIELEAVLRLDGNWKETRRPGDATIYHCGAFERDGRRLRVVAAASSEMGMPAAAYLTMKMIWQFRPRWLAMAGITAGVGLNFGDIVIADQSWDYGSGKSYKKKGGKSLFSPSPNYISLDPALKERLELFISQRKSVISRIQNDWEGPPVTSALKARLGPMASGAAVVENAEIIDSIKMHNRKVIGIEMETFGVYMSARSCIEPRPNVFSAKSVCDFGKPPKIDEFQRYAAYTSAAFIYEFSLDQLAAAT